jgi:hypothetical protein
MNGLPVSYDQYGQPFIILREQDRKKRVTGLEAQKVKKKRKIKKKKRQTFWLQPLSRIH